MSAHRLNQYTGAGPATFAYDANGNLTSDGSVSMVYDAENRLISASGAKTASLGYDPLGRLFQTGGGSAGVTQFLYDPGSKPGAGADELVAEYNGSGALLRRVTRDGCNKGVHGLGTDDPILWYEGAGLADRRSLQADHQGSIIGVANSAGASIAINAYDEWGIPNAGNQGRFQYTGQAWLPELGMYHYKARIYSPTLGRFLQTDPIGYEDQVNLYAYVGNDPVNLVDPSGKSSRCQISGACDTTGQGLEGTQGEATRIPTGEAASTSQGVVPGLSNTSNQVSGPNLPADNSARAPFTVSESLSNDGVNIVGFSEERLGHIETRHIHGLNEKTGKSDPNAGIFYARDRYTLLSGILKPALSSPNARSQPNTGGRPGLLVTSTLPYNVGVTGYQKLPTSTVMIVLHPVLGPFGRFTGWYQVHTAFPIP